MDNSQEALEEIEKARKIWGETYNINRQQEALFYKGLINLEMGSYDAAQKYKVDWRTAAQIVALYRLEMVYKERGIFP